MASAVVQFRHVLRGTGYTLHEVLSPAEQLRHAQLWPIFVAARDRGQHAQFSRARLVIDGVPVRVPAAPA